jgi:large subunit ribosomal protein L5
MLCKHQNRKVVVSSGVGSQKDKKKLDLLKIEFQKSLDKSQFEKEQKFLSSCFQGKTGDTVGMQVTLRGQRMYDFLDRVVNIALPRTKDFRGISGNGQ